MPASKEKKEILERGNYKYHFSREIYFNRDSKKIFSLEAIEDNPSDWLREKINKAKTNDEWEFNFNATPSETIRKEILKERGAC